MPNCQQPERLKPARRRPFKSVATIIYWAQPRNENSTDKNWFKFAEKQTRGRQQVKLNMDKTPIRPTNCKSGSMHQMNLECFWDQLPQNGSLKMVRKAATFSITEFFMPEVSHGWIPCRKMMQRSLYSPGSLTKVWKHKKIQMTYSKSSSDLNSRSLQEARGPPTRDGKIGGKKMCQAAG